MGFLKQNCVPLNVGVLPNDVSVPFVEGEVLWSLCVGGGGVGRGLSEQQRDWRPKDFETWKGGLSS